MRKFIFTSAIVLTASVIGVTVMAQHEASEHSKKQDTVISNGGIKIGSQPIHPKLPGSKVASPPKDEVQFNKRMIQYNKVHSSAVRALKAANTKMAEKLFRQAIPLAPVPDDDLNALAQIYMTRNMPHEATAAYRSLLDPNTSWESTAKTDPSIWMLYAISCADANLIFEAQQAYASGMGYSRRDYDFRLPKLPLQAPARKNEIKALAYLNRGIEKERQGKDSKAFEEYEKAAMLQPESAIVQCYYGVGLQRINRLKNSQEALLKATRLGNGEVKALAQQSLERSRSMARFYDQPH